MAILPFTQRDGAIFSHPDLECSVLASVRRFLGLALRPVPTWTGWFGIVAPVGGVTAAGAVAWLLAPGRQRTVSGGRVIIESASRWPWALVVFFGLLALLFLYAGARLERDLSC